MNRTKIINKLINKINGKRYLEIGLGEGTNFQNVECDYKVSVDPDSNYSATYCMNSDDFFQSKLEKEKFDVILVDGLHHSDQVYRDVANSLSLLKEGGYIVCHDLNPQNEAMQVVPWQGGNWNGDCWKAFVKLRSERIDLQMHTVDTDYGCGIISRGFQVPLHLKEDLTYANLEKNRKEWLNLISVKEFMDMYFDSNLVGAIERYISDPNDPEKNFTLALMYDDLGQTATAVSYYIRTAERTNEDILKYECLIRAAGCFERQGTRKFTVKGLMQHAIATMPKRPEAYYMMSRFYENDTGNDGKWFDSYLLSALALSVCDFDNLPPLRTKVNYPGKFAILFQKAHTAWWCGLCDDSKNMFLDLYSNYELPPNFKNLVKSNLDRLGAFSSKTLSLYNRSKHDRLKTKFNESNLIEQNYSEAYQDMFVLTLFKGKRNGTYLEIGSGHPTYGNNTYLLEKDYGWSGISFDLSEEFIDAHKKERKHISIVRDATSVNYDKFLSGLNVKNTIDYLQIDCDPPDVSFKVLLSIPFEKYKFGVITFEHDHYAEPSGGYREKARNYLKEHGYVLFASNISPDDNRPYEDWFVHPEVIDINEFVHLMKTDDTTKNAEKYMLR